MTEWILFIFFFTLLILISVIALYRVSTSFMVTVPKHGGSLTEGIIGSPRFLNPILATGDSNYDLTALIYSGLLKAGPDGSLIPDLAERYTISPDGLMYTFTLKPNSYFHDGTPVTAEDVLFTIERAQDPILKSPRRANWEGVTAEKIDDKTLRITLKQAYAPFLENATLGIMPKHIWQNVTIDEFPFSTANVEPIGSGPYRVKNVKRGNTGAPVSYTLESFDRYILGEPFIKTLIIKFYANESDLFNALIHRDIESTGGISPEKATALEKNRRLEKTPLPRVFGVFFNQNEAPLFVDKEVRRALDMAVDKKLIIETVLKGFGTTLEKPIPQNILSDETKISTEETTPEEKIKKAKVLLENAGWKYNEALALYEKKSGKKVIPLTFSLSTSNAPELRATAETLKAMWEKMGAKVELKIFEPGDLNQNVIRPRKFDALLFGEIVGRDLDLFAFWHSSQRSDPGLNIALYTNLKADKALEQARTLSDEKERLEKIKIFESEVEKDHPAIFLYAPDFIYVLPEKVKGFRLSDMTVPGDRFANVEEWYTETEQVWKIFSDRN